MYLTKNNLFILNLTKIFLFIVFTWMLTKLLSSHKKRLSYSWVSCIVTAIYFLLCSGLWTCLNEIDMEQLEQLCASCRHHSDLKKKTELNKQLIKIKLFCDWAVQELTWWRIHPVYPSWALTTAPLQVWLQPGVALTTYLSHLTCLYLKHLKSLKWPICNCFAKQLKVFRAETFLGLAFCIWTLCKIQPMEFSVKLK